MAVLKCTQSQGLTFDNVCIDLGSGAFVNGQLYTALSRCRTLEKLTLKRRIQQKDIIEDKRLINFYDDKIKKKSEKITESEKISYNDILPKVKQIGLLRSFWNKLSKYNSNEQ